MARSDDMNIFNELLTQQPLTISDAIMLSAVLGYLKRLKNRPVSSYNPVSVFDAVDCAITDSTLCVSTDWRLLGLTRKILEAPYKRRLP